MLHADDLQEIKGIGCIFLDMDGTLMNDKKEISEENIRELQRVQAKGIRLVIATGRLKATVPQMPESLHFDYYITSNGAAVYDHAMQPVFRKNMPPETTLQVAAHFTKDDYPEYFIDGEMHVDRDLVEHMDEYDVPVTNQKSVRTIAHHHDDLKNDIAKGNFGCEKICVFFRKPFDQAKIHRLREATAGIAEVHSVSGGVANLEFTDVNVSKAKAVAFVLDRMGLTTDQAAAFGDSENDMDLFRSVTYGIAVENACEELKNHAFALTLDNNADGVAYALKKIIR